MQAEGILDHIGYRLRRHNNKYIASQIALGRVGEPDDIGGAIALLLSEENRWMTGQRIEVSGGQSL